MNAPAPHDLVRVLDFETDSLEDPRAIEAAFCDVRLVGDRWSRAESWSTLVNPGRPIDVRAMAVHHIVDADVASAPAFTEILPHLGLTGAEEPVRVFAAHFAEFDRQIYKPADAAWICTWKCAVTIWPDAPGYKNQELRYWRGLKLNPELSARPHRAPDDAYVTAAILVQMLRDGLTVERAIEITEGPVVLPFLHFGMHAMVRLDVKVEDGRGGWAWAVPTSYLEWIIKQPAKTDANPKGMDPNVRHTAFTHITRRR